MSFKLTTGGKFAIASLALVALVTVAVHQSRQDDHTTREVRQQLRTMLRAKLPASIAAGDDSAAILIKRFYKQRRYAPAWNGAEPLPRAKELMEVLKSASTEGLDPDDYGIELIEKRLDKANPGPLGLGPQPALLADLDLRLTAAFLRYGSDLFDGRVDPRRLPTEWRTRPRRTSMLAKLQTAVESDRVRETLESLAPPHREYELLRDALARYREIEERGGWAAVPPGPALARNRSGSRVEALRTRLAATGDLPSSAERGRRFDATLERAVRGFQQRHGLEVTGRVGTAELAALNVPVEARIRQIEINMERWRWLPEKLGDPAIMVNIPDFMLHVVENGRPKLAMRVVVGKAVDRTPVFSDEISYVVFGPNWNIPRSIVTEELLPAVQSDPDYLTRKGIRVFDGTGPDAREVDARSVGGGWFGSDESGYAFRQDPGEENPLGRVKFMCPNQFDVYLHDTPADHLFQQRLRTFSHGCIRVEKPDELANYLLHGKDDWGPDRIAAAMDSARDQSVTLPRPIPVHILYWTAWVDEGGTLQFRADPYNLDAIVSGALRRHDRAVEERLSRL